MVISTFSKRCAEVFLYCNTLWCKDCFFFFTQLWQKTIWFHPEIKLINEIHRNDVCNVHFCDSKHPYLSGRRQSPGFQQLSSQQTESSSGLRRAAHFLLTPTDSSSGPCPGSQQAPSEDENDCQTEIGSVEDKSQNKETKKVFLCVCVSITMLESSRGLPGEG